MCLLQCYKPTSSSPPHVRESGFVQSTAASTKPQGSLTGKHPRYESSQNLFILLKTDSPAHLKAFKEILTIIFVMIQYEIHMPLLKSTEEKNVTSIHYSAPSDYELQNSKKIIIIITGNVLICTFVIATTWMADHIQYLTEERTPLTFL